MSTTVDVDPPADAAVAGRGRVVDRGRAEVASPIRGRSAQASSLLASRAAAEYDYVVRDVRRIGIVGGGLFVVLIVAYLLVEVAHVVTL